MQKDKVSIIILYSDGKEKYIQETLQSVLDQTYKNWEVIFWNDNGNMRVVDNFFGNNYGHVNFNNFKVFFTRIEIGINTKHAVPVGVLRYLALQKCTGKYVAILDADDVWYPIKLEVQINAFQKTKNIKFIYGNVNYIDGNGNDIRIKGKDNFFDRYSPYDKFVFLNLLTKYNFMPASSLIFDRKALLDVVKSPSHYTSGEDYDWVLKMSAKYDCDYFLSSILKYRILPQSNSHGLNRVRAQMYEIDCIKRNMNNRQLTKIEKLKVKKHLIYCYLKLLYKEFIE